MSFAAKLKNAQILPVWPFLFLCTSMIAENQKRGLQKIAGRAGGILKPMAVRLLAGCTNTPRLFELPTKTAALYKEKKKQGGYIHDR
ncbi:hypothetical protein P4E94_14815 [Pontiellaceae bacterium B12219]|nr:hypothetical protein [Pontiellaceae bacterium B12219]